MFEHIIKKKAEIESMYAEAKAEEVTKFEPQLKPLREKDAKLTQEKASLQQDLEKAANNLDILQSLKIRARLLQIEEDQAQIYLDTVEATAGRAEAVHAVHAIHRGPKADLREQLNREYQQALQNLQAEYGQTLAALNQWLLTHDAEAQKLEENARSVATAKQYGERKLQEAKAASHKYLREGPASAAF